MILEEWNGVKFEYGFDLNNYLSELLLPDGLDGISSDCEIEVEKRA